MTAFSGAVSLFGSAMSRCNAYEKLFNQCRVVGSVRRRGLVWFGVIVVTMFVCLYLIGNMQDCVLWTVQMHRARSKFCWEGILVKRTYL